VNVFISRSWGIEFDPVVGQKVSIFASVTQSVGETEAIHGMKRRAVIKISELKLRLSRAPCS